MVKHTQTIRSQQPINCFSVFDHFAGLALKGLTEPQEEQIYQTHIFQLKDLNKKVTLKNTLNCTSQHTLNLHMTRFEVLVRSRGHFHYFSSVQSIGNGHMFLEQNFVGNKNLQEKIQNYELFSCKMVIFNMRLKKNITNHAYLNNTLHYVGHG